MAFLGSALLVLQEAPKPVSKPAPRGDLVVEVGDFSMNGVWYQDAVNHVHDEVRIRPVFQAEDRLEVTIGTAGEGGTDLIFVFWRDEKGATQASVRGLWRTDIVLEDSPRRRYLADVEGRVLLQTNDWGPGKTINALFAVRGHVDERSQFLLGSFSLLLEK